MYELIYEGIAQAGLLKDGHILREKIADAPVDKLANLVLEITALTSAENVQREIIPFAHSASLSLGGERYPCSDVKCRLEKIHELMQFAVLYSDRVYMKDVLSGHIMDIKADTVSKHAGAFRERLTDDLIILNELRPVIEKGFVTPFTPPSNICPHCLAKRSFSRDGDAKLRAVEDYMSQRYDNEVSVRLSVIGNSYYIMHSGPESLVEHGTSGVIIEGAPDGSVPERLMPISTLVKKAKKGEEVLLSRTAERKIHRIQQVVENEMESICFELFAAQSFGTAFLTDRPVHIDALDILSKDNELEYRNTIAREHLTSILPFISGVPTDDLISIREAESDAFILYRRALNEAIDEYRRKRSGFSEKDARMLYADIIAPKLTVLDQKVKSTRRKLVKRSGISIGVWAGAITFGVYSGFVPPDLVKAAGALGLSHLVKSVAEGLDPTSNIQNEELYFLWKVRQKQKAD